VYISKIRDKFPTAYFWKAVTTTGIDNSFSYICCNPIASIKIENETIFKSYPDGTSEKTVIDADTNIPEVIETFRINSNQRKTNLLIIVCLVIFLMMPFVILKK
jgi:anthranilate synthase component 1